jgi:glutaredoxin
MTKNLATEAVPFDLQNVPKHIQQTELSKSLTTTQSIMVPRIVFNGKGAWEMKLGSESQKRIMSSDLNVIITRSGTPSFSRILCGRILSGLC